MQTPDFSDLTAQTQSTALRLAQVLFDKPDRPILLLGALGSGKGIIARRIPGLLNHFHDTPDKQRPFRAPHHTISDVRLFGLDARPGELQLAENGVLFLDDILDFRPRHWLRLKRTLAENRSTTLVLASSPAHDSATCQERTATILETFDPVTVFVPVVPFNRMVGSAKCPSTAELARLVQS